MNLLNSGVVNGGEVRVLIVAKIHMVLQMVIQLAKESH